MIPINNKYIYSFSEKDFKKYPNEKMHTGTFWKESDLHEFILYYNDVPILRTWKHWIKQVREHRDKEGRVVSRTLSDKTIIDVFDMDGNKIGDKEIDIIFAHNKAQDELPQLENEDFFKLMIRDSKIDEIIKNK